jgi:hypothetical protein
VGQASCLECDGGRGRNKYRVRYILPPSISFPSEYVQVGTTIFVVQVCSSTGATEGDVKGFHKQEGYVFCSLISGIQAFHRGSGLVMNVP